VDPPGSVHQEIEGAGRAFSALNDMHINEYHTHYSSTPEHSTTAVSGPASVRVPLTPRMLTPIHDRRELRHLLLQAALDAGDDPAEAPRPGVHVVYGLPGCGKTAVVQTVFDEVVARSDSSGRPMAGMWVDASSSSSFLAGMLRVAQDRGASQEEVDAARSGARAAADLVWHYLDHSPQRWLLVLDNADDRSLPQEPGWLRSSPRGTVLVTSRNGTRAAWGNAVLHPLDVLELPFAVDLLLDLDVDAGDLKALERLAEALACHPLALVLAGCFLGQQVLDPMGVQEYIERLRHDPGALLDQGAEAGKSDLRRLISTTWQLSLDMLTRRGTPEATTALRLLACFAPDPLPLGLLHPAALDTSALAAADPPLTGRNANRALLALQTQSLLALTRVPRDDGEAELRTVQVHALLLETVAARIPADQRDILLSAAADLLGRLVAPGTGRYIDAQTLRLFTPHAAALLRRAVRAGSPATSEALRIVRTLRDQHYAGGHYPVALTLAEEAAAADTGAPESSADAEALTDRHELARALRATGRYGEAVALHRSTLESRARLLGPEHPQTLDSDHALGLALYGLGAWDQDERHMRHAADTRSRVLGAGHPDALDSGACLAEAIGAQGRWAEAVALARDVLARSEEHLPFDHPQSLAARLTLAWALSETGAATEAEALVRPLHADSERLLGRCHPRTLNIGQLLAETLLAQERWAQAELIALEVITARERILGSEHPHTLAARHRLVLALVGSGQYDRAGPLARANLSSVERLLGPEHPDTAACRAAYEQIRTPPSPDTEDHESEFPSP
jgi:tetratricopeptide (TPR) repeat protein